MWQTLRLWIERFWPWLVAGLLGFQIIVEWLMGRPWICKCGVVKLWTGAGVTGDSSQHIADWYTLSHILHGILFYAFLWFVGRKWPVSARLLVAIGMEIAWEFVENSPFAIERYRHGTAAVDYAGDTIINSGFDTVWMMLGFALTLKLPTKWVIVLGVGFELLAGAVIRDNLTLNVLTFLWPIPAVVDWQSAA